MAYGIHVWENILTVNDIGDFQVGQGIAIYNATKLRNTENAWLCSWSTQIIPASVILTTNTFPS